MVRIILVAVLCITGTINSQNQESDGVKSSIKTFFKGFHKGDTTLMKSVVYGKPVMQTAFKNKEGQDVLMTDDLEKLTYAVANRPEHQVWDERLLDYKIQVDGNMASAWTPYEFWFNGSFSHCGVNSFQLFKDGNQWKIIYLIDTRRKKGCHIPVD